MSNKLKCFSNNYNPTGIFLNMNKIKSIIKVVAFSLSILGTTIGAGFVSGKEISNFFNCYGNFAYLMAIIMGVVYFFTLKLFFKCSSSDPLKNSKSLDYIISFSQFISLTAMIAGLNSLLSNYFGVHVLFYILCIICFIIILCGLKGLTNTNLILQPFLLAFILFAGTHAIINNPTFNIEIIDSTPLKIISYIFIYIGLDLFSCYPICLILGKQTSKKQQNAISIIVGITVTILLICYLITVLERGTFYAYFDLPILNYSVDNFDYLYLFACITIGIGITTTLLSNGFVLHETSKKLFPKNSFIVFLTLYAGAYLLSFVGFSTIVECFYPIIGIIGIILVFLLIIKTRKNLNGN